MTVAEEMNMADQTFQSGATDTGGGETLKSLGEQVTSAGRELKDKASDIAVASADKLKGQAADFVDAAKDAASQAADKLKDTVADKKGAGADYVGGLAETMRRAAREFDSDLPLAGTYIRKAASQVENVSDSIRTGNVNDVVRNAQAFARRQPTAFLGLAVLTGFAVVRFLKTSSEDSGSMGTTRREYTPADANNVGYRDDFSK
jgi:uncharacterized protein YjbJ (UPF0337 family)